MRRSFYFFSSVSAFLLLACNHTRPDVIRAPDPDPSQPLIHGTWALPVDTMSNTHSAPQMERKGNEIHVSLAVEHFENPGFDRFGYWDQSGNYEHAYGGDRSGSFTYRFTGMDSIPDAIEIKARLSAESQTQGKPDETSDVILLINGQPIGKRTVVPDNGVGRFYVWRVTNPMHLKKLRIMPGDRNELRFVIDQKAKKKNGLCIYGKALDTSAPEPGEPIKIVYRLDAKGGPP
jgi:hypothetical protein